eukprot:3492585-Rhodomonas_salina.1
MGRCCPANEGARAGPSDQRCLPGLPRELAVSCVSPVHRKLNAHDDVTGTRRARRECATPGQLLCLRTRVLMSASDLACRALRKLYVLSRSSLLLLLLPASCSSDLLLLLPSISLSLSLS